MKKFTILLVIVFSINLAIAADCHFDLPGDINNDCKTDLADFVIIANTWLIDCDVNRACCTMIFESNRWIRWLSGTDGSILCFPNTFS